MLQNKNGTYLKSLRQAMASIGYYSTKICPLMAYWALFTSHKRPQKAPNHTLQRTGGTVAVPTLLVQMWVVVSPLAAEHGAFSGAASR
jgi:hypothetical protein